LSEAGLTIVSGLALGIDAAAHRGGLRGIGSTIAVIGTGIDLVYPHSNRALAGLIAEQGCIVSEYALATPALPANFPRRNRLISGLARAVLVIEAAARSGSLITARMAGEQGRDVFAIPGSIHSALAKGCHALIKQGAKLVESADDVLVELQLPSGVVKAQPDPGLDLEQPKSTPTPEQQTLLAALGHDPVDLDSLAQRAGLDAASVVGQLLTLEMDGLVERLAGGLFQRNHKRNN
jgi:DNA processing protein